MQETNLQVQDSSVLDNVINKLQIYMDQNNQTLYGLASKMGFSYQPFYRIITKKHQPTLESLVMIAEHFNCTVAELIAEKVFCDVKLFKSIDDFITQKAPANLRVYMAYTDFMPLLHKEFFALENISDKHILDSKSSNVYVFYKTDAIDIDGIFLVQYKDKATLLNVVSVSSKFVIIEEAGKEIKIEQNEITVLAKFFNFLTINYSSVLTGEIR